MPSQGYTDWKRLDFAAGDIVVNSTAVFTDGQVLYQGPCHVWSEMVVHWIPNNLDVYAVRVIFFTDNTFTTFFNQQYINAAKSAEYSVKVPVQAPFCKVVMVRSTSGTFVSAATVFVFGCRTSGNNYELNRGEAHPMVANNDSFAISQTINYKPFYVVPGSAWLQVIPAGAVATNVALQVFSAFDNLTLTYMQWWGAVRASPVNQLVPIMAGDLTLVVANGATAQAIQVFLTPMPD